MTKPKKRINSKSKATVRKSRSSSVSGLRREAAAKRAGRLALPLLVSGCLLFGIAFIPLLGYRSATASTFFSVAVVDIRGVDRAPADDVRRIVSTNVEKAGVWLSDLSEIREKIEKLPFVKSAAVSMVLPAGIRVNVIERVPQAIVRTASGDFLVDSDGVFLARATKPEPTIPFPLRGWDESKTEKAMPGNLARLKLFSKLLDEIRGIGVVERVREVNLEDVRNPTVSIEDSGKVVAVSLTKDDMGKKLKSAVEAVAGKGDRVRSVNVEGLYPVLDYIVSK